MLDPSYTIVRSSYTKEPRLHSARNCKSEGSRAYAWGLATSSLSLSSIIVSLRAQEGAIEFSPAYEGITLRAHTYMGSDVDPNVRTYASWLFLRWLSHTLLRALVPTFVTPLRQPPLPKDSKEALLSLYSSFSSSPSFLTTPNFLRPKNTSSTGNGGRRFLTVLPSPAWLYFESSTSSSNTGLFSSYPSKMLD